MDKKPTIAILKNEIDKLKSSFDTEKDEKDTKINHILSVVEGLSKSLSLYIEDEDNKSDKETTNEIDKNTNLEDKVNCLEEDVQYLKNELKKKDADWQQKLDLIVHQFTKQYDSLKSSSFSRRENSVSQETSISQSVQNPIQIIQHRFYKLNLQH